MPVAKWPGRLHATVCITLFLRQDPISGCYSAGFNLWPQFATVFPLLAALVQSPKCLTMYVFAAPNHVIVFRVFCHATLEFRLCVHLHPISPFPECCVTCEPDYLLASEHPRSWFQDCLSTQRCCICFGYGCLRLTGGSPQAKYRQLTAFPGKISPTDFRDCALCMRQRQSPICGMDVLYALSAFKYNRDFIAPSVNQGVLNLDKFRSNENTTWNCLNILMVF